MAIASGFGVISQGLHCKTHRGGGKMKRNVISFFIINQLLWINRSVVRLVNDSDSDPRLKLSKDLE